MRGLFGLAAFAATLVGQAFAHPIVANPGTIKDIEITEFNTVNGTEFVKPAQANLFTFSLVNNFGGDQMYGYWTGKDAYGASCILSADGSFYYPTGGATPTAIPAEANYHIALNGQGLTSEFTVPDYFTAGRLWVSEGQLTFYSVTGADGIVTVVEPSFANPDDPAAGLNWGFVEMTNLPDAGIYANISFVDFVGLVMSMRLTLATGEQQTVSGLAAGAVDDICAGMQEQTAIDGQPWDQMCVVSPTTGAPLRVVAPNIYESMFPDSMADYYTAYVDEVYAKYTNEDLIIDTQGEWGQVPCRVTGEELWCEGDSISYQKPSTADIWGCNSGPFANIGDGLHKSILARLCAAFHRTELLIDGGNVTPSLGTPGYYTVDPTSHYSRLVHEYEVDNKGYAFSYDDVNPHGENAAGVVAGLNPTLLEVFIGGQVF